MIRRLRQLGMTNPSHSTAVPLEFAVRSALAA
jgi:hypothetical protein